MFIFAWATVLFLFSLKYSAKTLAELLGSTGNSPQFTQNIKLDLPNGIKNSITVIGVVLVMSQNPSLT